MLKVTKEELPKRMLSLHIEVPPEQVEKELDRAARRISQEYALPGFRKGKAPRFIIERYLGREALLEEASDRLINQALKEALKQEQITPIGQVSIQSFETNPFSFRVLLSLPPIAELPNYRDIRIPLQTPAITPEDLQSFIESLREKHVLLQELEEPRPAAEGDHVTLMVRPVFITKEGTVEAIPDADEEEREVVLLADRVLSKLYDALIGCHIGDERTIFADEDDNEDEDIARGDDTDIAAKDDKDREDEENKTAEKDKESGYTIRVVNIQQRILPDYDELPALEGFNGTFPEFRELLQQRLTQFVLEQSKQSLIREFLSQVVAQTTFEIPDVLIEQTAQNFLDDYLQEAEQQGTPIAENLSEPGPQRQQILTTLLPEAEQQVRYSLVLQKMIEQESLDVSKQEVEHELLSVLQRTPMDISDFQKDPHLSDHLLRTSIDRVVHRKLYDQIIAIATGEAAATADDVASSSTQTDTNQESESSVDAPPTDEISREESSIETDVSSKTG